MALVEHLALLKEKLMNFEKQVTLSKWKTEQYFNKRVKSRRFKKGDLVLRETKVTLTEEGKLGPWWEGPYVVVSLKD